ncbi:TetR/AcrR family transcriptional regulator [Phytomonospora sp. NPDC050363]|uniref:TetR/AcrR family transcriptional regulator n=1 Tax=Phytomonospora sp. NPDC050363 TaxID=3155642 RepID=UPI0033D133BA
MSRNPEVTRGRLLSAARREFSLYGLAGARVDRIAREAGVNKERIYAYFGSKELLYDTVIELALQQIRLATPLEITDGEDVGDFVRRVFEFHRRDPSLMRIFMWESLEMGSRDLIADAERRAFYRERIEDMAAQLGIADLGNARRLFLTLVGMAGWPAVMPNLAHLMTDGDTDGAEGQEALRDFLVRFAVAGAAGAAGIGGGTATSSGVADGDGVRTDEERG